MRTVRATYPRFSGWMQSQGRQVEARQHRGPIMSKEEELAALGMRWEVRGVDLAYDRALAEQQQAALAALRVRHTERAA